MMVHLLLAVLIGYFINNKSNAKAVENLKCEVPTIRHGTAEKSIDDGTAPLQGFFVPPETEIVISCDPGYAIENGPNRVICLPLGTWSGRIAECKSTSTKSRITCSAPIVENGSLRVISPKRRLGRKAHAMERLPVGTRIHLRCDRDFFLMDGSFEATCTHDGKWSVDLGKCLPISSDDDELCGEEPKVIHGTAVARTSGTRTVECDDGYQLIGSGIIRCQRDGSWSYAENTCQRVCGKVPLFSFGYVGEGSSFVGSEREVGCFTGYELKGPKRIECNSTGHWTTPGFCEKTCGDSPLILSGTVEDGPSTIGTERKITCNPGFALSGLSVITCNVNSRWVVGAICRKACGIEPSVLNGVIKSGEFAVGSERPITCDVGFVLKGPSSIRCGEDAKWSEPGFCKKESIHMAAEMGDIDVVKLLIKSQPELLETQNVYGDSPLWRAAHNGQVEVVKLLISEGANIESKGLYGRTPLHEAAALGHTEVVKALLKQGANVYAKSDSHDSEDMPIHLAAFEGHLEIVRVLIDANPDLLDKKDMHGRTPTELAKISTNLGASDILRFLKSKTCDGEPVIPNGHISNGTSWIGVERTVTCKDGFSLTGPNKIKCKSGGQWTDPGSCVAKECSFGPVVVNGRISDGGSTIGSERTVTCLHGFVLTGANKIRCDKNTQWTTPGSCEPSESIFWATTMGHEQVVRVLLEKRPELLDERDRSNTTIFTIAAAYGHLAILEYLLTKPGVNIEVRDKDGRTPLAIAASKGHLRVVKMLVKRGANVHAKSYSDDYEDQPVHFAAIAGHSDIVEYFVAEEPSLLVARNRDGDHPIHRAVVGGHIDTVKALLELGANLESKNNDGWTPLCHAAAEGNVEIVRLLVDRGANVYARSNADDDEDMPIHLASYFGHQSVVSFLVEKYPDLLKAKNREGESPINRAAVGGHNAVVEFLLSKGVDIETKGFRGRTPLHEAASKGHLKLVKMLVRNNANVTARSERETDRGSLPIHLASYFGQLDVVKFLVESKPELVEAKNARGQTPLEHAVAGGSLHHAEDVVRFLTEKIGSPSGPTLLP